MEFTGRLAIFPVPNLLQWAQHERQTGCLVLRGRRAAEKRILFSSGAIVGCRSTEPNERYGQYLVAYGHLAPAVLAEALIQARRGDRRLGATLREMGLLAPEAVRDTLRSCVEDSICDLFFWRKGLFYFEEETVSEEDLPPGTIDTTSLTLEGSRWLDEESRIRKVLINDEVVVRQGPAWPGASADPLARRVVAALDREMSLDELCRVAGGVRFRFLAAVHDLVQAGVLEIARVGAADPRESRELNLRDLLLQQAADSDDIVISGERAIVPLEFLQQLVPVWIRAPREEELRNLAREQRGFLEAIDGRTPLRRLLAAADALRGEQVELLLLELKRRNLALLPAPPEDVERRLDESAPLSASLRRILRKLQS